MTLAQDRIDSLGKPIDACRTLAEPRDHLACRRRDGKLKRDDCLRGCEWQFIAQNSKFDGGGIRHCAFPGWPRPIGWRVLAHTDQFYAERLRMAPRFLSGLMLGEERSVKGLRNAMGGAARHLS